MTGQFTANGFNRDACPANHDKIGIGIGHKSSRGTPAEPEPQLKAARDSQHAKAENRATHGPQVQAGRGHRRLAEAANIVAGHGNTGG